MLGVIFAWCNFEEQSGEYLDRSFLARQLRAQGVPELLQVVGQGFPHRVPIAEALGDRGDGGDGVDQCMWDVSGVVPLGV